MQSHRGAPGRLGVAGLAAALIMALSATQAQVSAQAQWKWKDSSGQVHVSDLPPPREIADKDVLERPNPSARRAAPVSAASAPASAAGARARVDPELEARRAKAEHERLAKAKADDDALSAQRGENCQRARAHLSALDTGQRIARLNSKGEREVLDDKGRAEEMQRARQVIASDCR